MKVRKLLKKDKKQKWVESKSTANNLEKIDLKKVDDYDEEVNVYGRLHIMLVALDMKEGSDFEVFFKTKKRFNEFKDLLNKLGIDCYIKYDPDTTSLENFGTLYEDNEVIKRVNEKLDREVVARVFITKNDSYDQKFFINLVSMRKNEKYHRLYGEFLGYPKKDIETFVYQQKPRWKQKIIQIKGEEPSKPLNIDKALKDSNFTEKEKETLKAFNSHILCGEKECLQRAVEKSMEKRRKLEELGVDVDQKIENLVF